MDALVLALIFVAGSPEEVASERIDAGELKVQGTRPAPGVIFVDGGLESLRRRMRSLAAEAGDDPLARPVAQTPKSEVRVLRVEVVAGEVDGLLARRLVERVIRAASLCEAGTGARARVSLSFSAGRMRAGRLQTTRATPAHDVEVSRCVVAAARRTRFPSAEAELSLELGLSALRE